MLLYCNKFFKNKLVLVLSYNKSSQFLKQTLICVSISITLKSKTV